MLLTRAFETALRKAEIKDFHSHGLRHTFSTKLVVAEVDSATVKELMGHKDIKMTLRYAYLSANHKKRVAALLEKTFSTK